MILASIAAVFLLVLSSNAPYMANAHSLTVDIDAFRDWLDEDHTDGIELVVDDYIDVELTHEMGSLENDDQVRRYSSCVVKSSSLPLLAVYLAMWKLFIERNYSFSSSKYAFKQSLSLRTGNLGTLARML